jgi:hypothetical protein
MPTPSLLIVPARFKTGTLYSQIPVPVAPSTSSVGDFTVTRATTATRVNASGLIESVASGIPRLDYFASGGVVGCPALLVEPSAQNLCLQSEAFNTTWTLVTGGTGLLPVITANAVVAPDGTTTADRIVFNRGAGNSSSDFSQIQQVVNLAVSGTYTLSVYAKATTSGDVGKQFYIRAKNNLVSGSLTSSWVRYTNTETGVASGNTNVIIGNRGAFTADNSVSVDLWGAQLETGSVATSYIPTTTASVTRNADVISVSGAVSGSIGQTEGTLYAEVDVSRETLSSIITIDDGDTSDFINIIKNANLTIRVRIRRASGTITSIITSSAVAVGVHKIALGYKNGDYALYIDGVSAGTSTDSTNYPATSLTQCVLSNTNYGPFNDRIRAAALYTTRLTDTQLATLTSL